jgi:hypothetical protein
MDTSLNGLLIYIPGKPLGINNNLYGYAHGRVYKKKEAKEMESRILGIAVQAMEDQLWKPQTQYYGIKMYVFNSRLDIDGPTKLIIDSITRGIGVDDKYVLKIDVVKLETKNKEPGVFIELYPIHNYEWFNVTHEVDEWKLSMAQNLLSKNETNHIELKYEFRNHKAPIPFKLIAEWGESLGFSYPACVQWMRQLWKYGKVRRFVQGEWQNAVKGNVTGRYWGVHYQL